MEMMLFSSHGKTVKNRIWGSVLSCYLYLKGVPDKIEIPEIKKIKTKHEVEEIVKKAAKYYGISEGEILKRKKATERQRKIAIYLSKTLSGKKNVEVGRIFGITLQAVTNAVRDIERLKEENKKINKEIEAIRREIGDK